MLEGLEPVRRRPGMYIGGTDENALHHLAAEVLDNAMDEAVAGHADRIEVTLEAGNWLTVRDNGRGIPVDPHPKFPKLSALEVILTTLHSGGKFSRQGLRHLGRPARRRLLRGQRAGRAAGGRGRARPHAVHARPTSAASRSRKLKNAGAVHNRRGTTIRFQPDPEIFGKLAVPGRRGCTGSAAPRPICSAASRSAGPATRRWSKDDDARPQAVLHFPGGLADFLASAIEGQRDRRARRPSPARPISPTAPAAANGRVTWLEHGEGFLNTYCNTIPTPQGGTHEAGLRAALVKGLRAYGELKKQKARGAASPPRTCSAAWRACSRSSSATRSSRARPRTS